MRYIGILLVIIGCIKLLDNLLYSNYDRRRRKRKLKKWLKTRG